MNAAGVPTFAEMVDEVAACTGLDRRDVAGRLWNQALGIGNVAADVERFGVTPHQYDDAMESLYRESYGFIFETLLYATRPSRRRWSEAALERIARHANGLGRPLSELRILVYGDGTGADSLFLAQHGAWVDYFDIPGSRTFAFACKRFERRGVLDAGVRVVTDPATLRPRAYDVVLTFEVLEHLTDPLTAIAGLAEKLVSGGIALVTEAFESISPALPTHLASNYKYRDTTPFLFLRAGLHLTWCAADGKPMEFQKRRSSAAGRYATALRTSATRKAMLLLLRRKRWRELRMDRAA